MNVLFRTGLVAAFLAFAGLGTPTSTAQAQAQAQTGASLSEAEQMLVGGWRQGAERVVGEGDEQVRISQGTEIFRSDGTSSATLRLELLSASLPNDLRVYDVAYDALWSLEGDNLVVTPGSVAATYSGENPIGANIAKAVEAEFMKPTEPMTLISLTQNDYVAKSTDGTLISMARK